MRFKVHAHIFVCVILVLDGIEAVNFSFGRGSSRGSSLGSSSRGSTHGRLSPGISFGRTSHGTSYGGRSHGTSNSGGTSHTTSGQRRPAQTSTSGSQNTAHNVNTQFLHGEGGGATRPAQPPHPTNSHPAVPPVGRPVVTENKQTSPPQPSAPFQDHGIMKSTAGTTQNQGAYSSAGPASPPWSNPYLNSNKPVAPVDPHSPWKPNSVPNPGTSSVPSGSPWNNPRPGDSKPISPNSQPSILPGSQPPAIGFREHVYPQSHPTSAGTQFGPPKSGNPPYPIQPMPTVPHLNPHSASGHPPYPTHPMPSGSPWSKDPSMSPPLHQTSSMPLGNPYSMHPHAGAYSAPSGVPNGPMHYGQPYPHPQQMAQPAVQPFVPGQTILMVPGQQSSGPGFGQLVKEALVFSTINAGVNRLINPHTRYVETRPAETVPSTETHITYNNHYINTAPGATGNTNPTSVPHGTTGSIPAPNTPAASNNPTGGFTPNVGNSNVPSGNTNAYIGHVPVSVTLSGSPAVSGIETAGSKNLNNNLTNSTLPRSNLSDSTVYPELPTYRISDDELYKISEELFARNIRNLSKYIKLNLQAKAASTNITDEAKEPLFQVDPELFEYPTIYVTRSLYENYEYDFRKKLARTLETRKQENLLIDTFLETSEMSTAMQWLADRGFIDPDDFERKDVLRRIWFTIFSGSTCGFERVFAAENYGTAVIGVQDWIYFATQESLKRVNYMGYVDKLDLGNTASLLKLNFEMDGIVRPNATIFVGTLPELEMSLYTICFHARPNNVCPVSLGGTKFTIYTHSFTYFGKGVIDLGLPMF